MADESALEQSEGPSPSLSTGTGGSGGGGTKRKRRIADLTPDEVNQIVALRGKMSQAAVGKRFGIDQSDVSAIQRQKGRLDGHGNKVRRLRDVELVVPICFGSIAFWLGKKADEFQSHRWTVYLRSFRNEDLTGIVKKVVYSLHPSFTNPTRVVEAAPFELTETGWGEFEIGITVYFPSDISEKPVELSHHLKLYPEDESVGQSTKKPEVHEQYDELVFPDPAEPFFERLKSHPAVQVLAGHMAPDQVHEVAAARAQEDERRRREWESVGQEGGKVLTGGANIGATFGQSLAPWFLRHSDKEELEKLAIGKQQVEVHMNKLNREYKLLETEIANLRSGHFTPSMSTGSQY